MNKLIFVTLCGSILCCFLIAKDYEDQRKADKVALANAIAEARQAERTASTNVAVQRTILLAEVHRLMPTVPDTALHEIKAPAVMHRVR